MTSFFWKTLRRSIFVRSSRSLVAVIAITVAAAISSAVVHLYADARSKLTSEFQRFGANVTVESPELDPAALKEHLRANEIIVPLIFVTGADAKRKPVVIVGTDIEALKATHPYWNIQSSGDVFVGTKVAATLDLASLNIDGKPLPLTNRAAFESGDADDHRIFIPATALRQLAPDARPQLALLSVPGNTDVVSARVSQLRSAFPRYRFEPMRRILDAQTSVVLKTGSVLLLCAALIAAISALSLFASWTASVFERRRDVAVLKALGASGRAVALLFVAEGAVLAIVGATAGFAIGCGISAAIGYWNFQSTVQPRLELLPLTVAVALVITAISALLPIRQLQKIQPAAMLKGE